MSTKGVATMTEPTGVGPSAEQLERIEQIRLRRNSEMADSARNPRRRRRHVGQGSRIVAAGLGAGTMFGIVTVLGLDNPATKADADSPATTQVQPVTIVATAPPPIQVIIHRVPPPLAKNTANSADAPPLDEDAPATPQTAAATVLDGPVQLTATPVVKTITVSASSQSAAQPTPEATTRGSV
jgi:hypothetical protein